MMKERLDVLLVKQGLAQSREKARAVIMAGDVFVDGQREDKAGTSSVRHREAPHGQKLEASRITPPLLRGMLFSCSSFTFSTFAADRTKMPEPKPSNDSMYRKTKPKQNLKSVCL